jgi:hypothetical protein
LIKRGILNISSFLCYYLHVSIYWSISKDDDRGYDFDGKRRMLMKLGRSLFGIAIFFIVTVVASPCFLRNAQAFREERGGQVGRGEREGEFAVGPRGGAVAEGAEGGVIVRGPQGNVYVGRAVGDRVAVLPDSANSLIVGDQTYFVDGSGVYYLPCDDDNTVYCVVPDPQ